MTVAQSALESRGFILCVEDEPDLRADIIDELRSSGYEAIGADDGQQALEILNTVRPDLVLCDISMPGMDGYALLDAVRNQRADLGDVPFVFLTALNTRTDVITGTRAGADDYLIKPIDFDLMLASIEARIAQAQRIRALHNSASRDSAEFEMTADVLDILSFGVVLAGRNGEVAFANAPARALAGETEALSIRDGLRAGTAALTKQLRSHVAAVADAAQRGEDVMEGMALKCPDGEGEIMLVICSLSGCRDDDTQSPVVAIFISDPANRSAPPRHMLAALFGLTPAEAEVAHGLVGGRRCSDIARDLGISQTTVAFHLRNLFEKTGTHRQVDLVALIMQTLAAVGPDRPVLPRSPGRSDRVRT